MQVKDFLMQGRWVMKEIEELAEAREKAYLTVTSITQRISKEKVNGGRRDKDGKLAEYVELSVKIDKKISELLLVKEEIFDLINSLKSGIERTLLTAKYINFKTWEEISEETDYSVMQLHRIHKVAIDKLEKNFAQKKKESESA